MKLEEVTLKDNFRFLKDGEGAFMHIVGLVSITFLPGIPWPRTGSPLQLFNILSSPFSTFLPDTAGAINHVESVVPKGVTLPALLLSRRRPRYDQAFPGCSLRSSWAPPSPRARSSRETVFR